MGATDERGRQIRRKQVCRDVLRGTERGRCGVEGGGVGENRHVAALISTAGRRVDDTHSECWKNLQGGSYTRQLGSVYHACLNTCLCCPAGKS